MKQKNIQSLLSRAGVPKRFIQAKLTDFPAVIIKSTVQCFGPQGHDSVYITGLTGSGKTHLAVGIVQDLIEHDLISMLYSPSEAGRVPDMKFINTPEFLFSLRESIRTGEEGLMASCVSTGLLIMDDLGAEKISEWALECLYIIINKRYEQCLPCIFTGNLPADKLEGKLGKRVARRIEQMSRTINLKG